jgi:epoxyqueuosine reductase
MLCQQFCPENKDFLKWFEGNEAFSHEETSLLINSVPAERLPDETQAKLERLGMPDLLGVLPRNLGVILSQ